MPRNPTHATPMMHASTARATVARRREAGFTLIELMITVAIVGILAAIALPAYMNYVIRGKLVAMTNQLTAYRTAMEQYYQDNRSYSTVNSITSPCSDTTNWSKTWGTSSTGNFTLACAINATSSSPNYVLTATGTTGSISGAAYTVDQNNNMATTSFPTTWGGTTKLPSTTNCWLMKKGDSC
jgi:prepilin-type N-terminal cleavage/methylation domain-containing protein